VVYQEGFGNVGVLEHPLKADEEPADIGGFALVQPERG